MTLSRGAAQYGAAGDSLHLGRLGGGLGGLGRNLLGGNAQILELALESRNLRLQEFGLMLQDLCQVLRLDQLQAQLRQRLERAEAIIDLQKKVAHLLGTALDPSDSAGRS